MYSLRFEERPEYLFAEVRDEHVTFDIVRRYMTEMQDMCIRTGHRHLLVRRDIPDALPTGPAYRIFWAKVPVLHGLRTAVLNPYPSNHERLEFATKVATDRGEMYALFSDLAAAEKWLGTETPNHHSSHTTPPRGYSSPNASREWIRFVR